MLSDCPQLVSVFVTSSAESAARRVSQRDGLSVEESAAKIASVNKERADYYSQHTENRWGSADSYDICVNTNHLGTEGAAQVVVCAVTGAMKKREKNT